MPLPGCGHNDIFEHNAIGLISNFASLDVTTGGGVSTNGALPISTK